MRTYGPKNIVKIQNCLNKVGIYNNQNQDFFNARCYGPDTTLPNLTKKSVRRYYYNYSNNIFTFEKTTNAVFNKKSEKMDLRTLNLKSRVYCTDIINENPPTEISDTIPLMFTDELPNNSKVFIEVLFLEYTDKNPGLNPPIKIKPLYQYRIYRYGVIVNNTIVLFRNNRRNI